jgi:acetylornithine deacetylase
MQARAILERLIAFDTVSARPNRALMDYVAALLADAGVAATLIPDATGGKANLYATIGPQDRSGVMLSGSRVRSGRIPPFS